MQSRTDPPEGEISPATGGHGRRAFGYPVRAGVGAILLAVSLLGILHGSRAAVSQAIHYRLKYRPAWNDNDLPEALARCETAYSLYPYSYRLCQRIAKKAYRGRYDDKGDEVPERIAAARLWCKRGLALNPYKRRLRLIQARLLARKSPREAMEYWEEYVGWEFWRPANHSVRVGLYLKAGEFARAAEALKWVRGSKYYRKSHERLLRAWREEAASPP